MGKIVWLASYPKSGNTWLRVFLTNLLFGGEFPADINQVNLGRAAASRRDFDKILGVESSDMTRDEIERGRQTLYRRLAAASAGSFYLKVHDAYVYTRAGDPLIPADVTNRAVYLVRNPGDVAVSLAHHTATTIDSAIASMADHNYAFGSSTERLATQLEQRLLSWSEHVRSWADQTAIPVHLMRYEDMHRQPMATFQGCLEFLGIDAPASDIERALGFSSFSVLNAQEQASGFRERPSQAETFFRSGRAGEWRQRLTDKQIGVILREHSGVMRRLGYIDQNGSICP